MSTPPPPTALPYEPNVAPVALAYWPAVRAGTLVYGVAVLCRHATYWSRAMLVGTTTGLAMLIALAEMATLVATLVLVVGAPTPRRLGGLMTCAIVLLVLALLSFVAIDLAGVGPPASPAAILRLAWALASRAQFCAIPVMLLVAARGGTRAV